MVSKSKYNLIVILGPTASGKTKFAAHLATQFNAEIISADSRQVYKRMDLGTGKDYDDYLVNSVSVPYHLIDIHEPGHKYNVFEFQKDFVHVFTDIATRGKLPILCGGTGMYIDAVTKGYKLSFVPVNSPLRELLKGKTLNELEKILKGYKRTHNRSDTDTIKRAIRAIEIEDYYENHEQPEFEMPEVNPLYIGLDIDRELRRSLITNRLHQRLKGGMIEEVQSLLDEGIAPENLIYYGLEYKFITQYLIGEICYETMVGKLNIAIHQFAKRQMTWFRKMEKENCIINWINSSDEIEAKIKTVKDLFFAGES